LEQTLTPENNSPIIKVLVVEDEPATAQVCLRVLTPKGYHVTLAADGREAIRHLSTEKFNICLTDVRTPNMRGEELNSWILEHAQPLSRGVILTTGDVVSGETARFLAETGRPTLPKPFSPAELVEKIQTVVARF
jgi:CheY-like chemotaxis protein